ncbi:MAG: glycosyltransferase family 4 protein, partial [Fimbriiglobus sp.]
HGGWTSDIGREFGAIELADQLVCQSDFAAGMLATTRPVTVIKGGVDGRRFTPAYARAARDRVLFVGRLLPHKGVDQLIRALPPDIPLTCCGRPYHSDYFRVLQSLAIGKRVEFVTDADDAAIRDQYARAWAVVLPSVYRDYYGVTHGQPELMGFSLLEGMACGTPAVCPRVGGMPEFVRHGQTGYVYDNLDELSGYLTALATDPALADRMGTAARRAVDAEFDLRVCGAKLVGVYAGLLGRTTVARRAA